MAFMRPILTYACPVWLLLTPFLMGKVIRHEYHILCGIFGRYRRMNGRYFSYRSRIHKAEIPGIDTFLIWLTRRHLEHLGGREWSSVHQLSLNWFREMELVRNRCFTTEGFMFLGALGLNQDREGRNIFHNLNRHGLSSSFNIRETLLGHNVRRERQPTDQDMRYWQKEFNCQSWSVRQVPSEEVTIPFKFNFSYSLAFIYVLDFSWISGRFLESFFPAN